MGAARELFEDNSVYTGREVKRMLALVPADGGREVGTTEAHRLIGRSSKFWRIACEQGEIDGAYKDGTRWRFRLEAARAYLARRKNRNQRGVRRGPNRKASSPQAGRAGATGPEAGPVLLR